MKPIEQTYAMQSSFTRVRQVLVDPHRIDAWGGEPAKLSAKEGLVFSSWDGDIHGTNTKVALEQTVARNWFGDDWSDPSKVTFTHKQLPEAEVDDLAFGWEKYYIGAIKAFLEQHS